MKRILLIDDDYPTNYYNEKMLKKVLDNPVVIKIENAEEALTFLKNEEEERIDYIFLDVNMPEMNGWEFLENYKKVPDSKKADTLIIMLTTSLNPHDRKKAEANPLVNDFLTKPLNKEKIEKIICS
ncbi:response regulator [Flammeovirga sp. MY04]|uniref:response regulator n=1 Tax=Flammeovirga sp. MY04 TaxID=1191459 RepID=UPI0008060E4D|nr:response regulator [Flammeovirga sp. MY04]ANQ49538.1 response regulator [Flammeovirga sp. MY04]